MLSIDRQALKEALLLTGVQLCFTVLFSLVVSTPSFFRTGVYAVPFSALALALILRKQQLPMQWIKYTLIGAMMLALTWLLYMVEERYMAGFLAHALGELIVAVWNFFPGVFKLVAAVLLIFLGLLLCALFFAAFLCVLVLANIVFTTWVLPRFDKLMD